MNENCYNEEILQAFLDGELDSEKTEQVACHIAVCDECTLALAAAEEETAFAFSVLDDELNELVPTSRLWSKINHSIKGKKKTVWQSVFAYFANPTFAAFAALLLVFSVFVGLSINKYADETLTVKNSQEKQNEIAPISESIEIAESAPVQIEDAKENIAENVELPKIKEDKKVLKKDFVKSKAVSPKPKNAVIKRREPKIKKPDASAETAELLPGEAVYIKTIQTLTKTVDRRKDSTLDASARFAFEKNLAVTDDAINKMQAEVQKNPKNDAAKEVLRVSYQNKIDLLNSIQEKTELMASLDN